MRGSVIQTKQIYWKGAELIAPYQNNDQWKKVAMSESIFVRTEKIQAVLNPMN